jgi:hypothetical protein
VRAATRRTLAGLALAGSAAVAASAVGCSLGLDKSLIGAVDAGGGDGNVVVESGSDAPVKPPADGKAPEGDAPVQVTAGTCNTDSDCTAEAAPGGSCTTAAKCDPTWHVCLLTTCSVGACKAAVCNTGNQTCSVPTTYGFEATQFSVQAGGVGAGVRFSIAAAWPFVFVITTNGVVAYNVVDPTNSDPPTVPLHGVPFIPIATLAVGRRVYFLNGTQGQGPTYREAVAWVDVPQDSLLTDLTAQSAFVGTPDDGVVNVLTNGSNGAFVVYGSGTAYPTANVAPPLDDTTVLTPFPNPGLATGAAIAASSGARLVTYRYDSSALLPNFAMVNGAGSSTAQTTGEEAIDVFGPLANQAYFGTGGDGSLLWTTGVYALNDAGAPAGIATARLTWLLDSATAANFDTSVYLDIETYSPPTGAVVTGPPLWIDANTALGLAAASSASPDTTSVQLVTKSPAAVDVGTRTLLSASPSLVGVAASGGFGYVLAQDDPKNLTCSVYIFAPSCGGGDD